ncbi:MULTISPECIES: DUF4345 domain-containing protein [unclassified Sphingomonas]|uniref:DUF4345 domain-containing protein n=1 Tax=unclassified Sphingomonas TaxID=196159 RepID=UPI0007018B77|nr:MULTISPECIES: DUF4345 domain-containing protein [unclassified Sphingomonas]KQX25947.1 hypothetical protein ASD17_00285 [Sphingomonas sp. Root1294]KQY69012.1 hypothetical protein ASD39_01480 [Sphingomonas sp. Root50]KRB89268.1 hypothetical protein ASE22_16395 [Sphingomonas sp. Root720]
MIGERTLLKGVVAIACLVPILTGLDGVLRGAAMMRLAAVPADLDSHYRYLSGIFLVLGLAFASTIPAIERQGPRFRLLGAMVVVGGLARLLSWAMVGEPGVPHRLGLVMELVVVPLLMLWQARIARRAGNRDRTGR